MKRRTVAVVAERLSKRPRRRLVRLRPVIKCDYLRAIQDWRDARVQLIYSAGHLRIWIHSFRDGRCVQPAPRYVGVRGRIRTCEAGLGIRFGPAP